ncbi:MAG: hypothetical protein Kow0063_11830 [Anaerolineae bacterium]
MSIDDLHVKYAPIMRFSRGERFFPMAVDDFLSYCAFYTKGQEEPLIPRGKVTRDDLSRHSASRDGFLRSVTTGPLRGIEAASQWGLDTVRLLYEWSQTPAVTWTESWARSVYDWFSEKTRAATQLFWWNNLLLPKAQADKEDSLRKELPRFELPQGVRASAIEAYQTSQGKNPAYTYYYRHTVQAGYLDLQYWFYYPYNDWASGYGGFNDHEGDWEGFHVFFKLDGGNRVIEPPAYVCYLDHHSRMTKAWDHPEVEKVGTHPVVYVAAGSHASYPQARQYPLMALYNLIDYATGEAFTLDHDAWRRRVNLDTVPWLTSYLGSWGTRFWLPLGWMQKLLGGQVSAPSREVHLPGVSAPRGPRFDDKGAERATWVSPATFAGIA